MIANDSIPIKLRKQYIFLKVYSFLWWAFFSMIIVFQNIYFKQVGIDLDKIFINSAIAIFFSMFIVNVWSRISDNLDQKKKFIIAGNIVRILAYLYLPFVRTVPQMLIFTVIYNAAPNPDSILIAYIYKISDYLDPEELKKRPAYHRIRTYAEIRKFGSIGWASMLPIAGLLIDYVNFEMNFIVSAIGFAVLNIIFLIKFDEKLISSLPTPQNEVKNESSENLEKPKLNVSLFDNIKKLLRNNSYKIFIIVTFIIAISDSMGTTVFSIFNSKFTQDSYLLLGLTWSINAFIEYPVMSAVSKRVEKYGWEKVVVFTYLLGMVRLLLNPLLLIFNGTIIWIYFFQIINGFKFGLMWPSTTYGLNKNLDNSQRSLGMTFYNSIKLMGNFSGNLIGALIAVLIVDENLFYGVFYVLASVFALIAALVLYFQSKKNNT